MTSQPSTSFEPRIVLRPRSLDETLDLSLTYLQRSGRDFARLFVVTFVLEAFVLGLVALVSIGEPESWRYIVLATILLAPILERSVTVFAGRHLFGNLAKTKGALFAVFRALPSLSTVSLVVALPVIGMVVTGFEEPAWISLGVLLGMVWPFVLASRVHLLEVLLLEQIPLRRAAQRANALVTHRFGNALGLLSTCLVVRWMIVLIVHKSTVFVLEVILQFGGMEEALGYWPGVVGYVLAGPFIALVRVFDYVDTRTRREGWDIQVRFNAIAQRAQEEEARPHHAP